MTDLVESIRRIIEQHREGDPAGGRACGCGTQGLSDHSRHVAHEIVNRLGLTAEKASSVRNEIRYVSAWFDNELIQLEGAE